MARSCVGLMIVAALSSFGGCGCGTQEKIPAVPARAYQGITLVVAAVGDRAILDTVNAQRGEWEERQRATVTIRNEPVDPAAARGVDVVIYPGDRLGDLVDAGVLEVLSESALVSPPRASDEGEAETKSAAEPEDHYGFSDI